MDHMRFCVPEVRHLPGVLLLHGMLSVQLHTPNDASVADLQFSGLTCLPTFTRWTLTSMLCFDHDNICASRA